MAERVRIQKAIANAGLMSRRAAEEAMLSGRVLVNGKDVVLGDRVDLENDEVTVDGLPLAVNPEIETHLLYKPVGIVSTARDPQGRPTVVELIEGKTRLYPVGRLDIDSEGLILVSNDGQLTNRVTHPSYGVTKTYFASVRGNPRRQTLNELTTGVELSDGPAKAVSARIIDSNADVSLVEVVMEEGRNREVRRMFDSIGHPIDSLVRTAIGGLTDRKLRPGMSRLLSANDIRKIFQR